MGTRNRQATVHGATGAAALVLATLLAGCNPTRPAAPAAATLPVTYAGTLTCASCTGIAYRITLQLDGSYWYSQQYLGQKDGDGPVFREIGRVVESAGALELHGTRDMVERWQRDGDALRRLDAPGTPVGAPLPGLLSRQPAVDASFGPVRVRGMFRYMAAVASFESCEAGVRYGVDGGDGFATLELEYSRSRHAPGAPMLVAFTATLEPKPADAAGSPTWVRVDAFERTAPGARCGGSAR